MIDKVMHIHNTFQEAIRGINYIQKGYRQAQEIQVTKRRRPRDGSFVQELISALRVQQAFWKKYMFILWTLHDQ